MDQNATNSAPADSSSAGGNDDTSEDFEVYASRMDAGDRGDRSAGKVETRVPAAQGADQGDQGGQDDPNQGQQQNQGQSGQQGKEDRRPWKRILAANAAARNSEAARKAAELEAENARLRQLVGGTPAPGAGVPAAQAPAGTQAPALGPKPKPREEDFVDPATGKFDGQAYLDARDEWRDGERDRLEHERTQNQAQEHLQEEEAKRARTLNASFWGKAAQMAEEIPDAMETLQGMSHPDIAGRIPPKVQMALLEADPLVMYAIAHREDLLASVMSTDVASSLRLVGHLEGLLAQYQNQQGAAAGAPADNGQTAADPSLMAPQAAQPARNTSGQFVAGMPATPPRPQPRAPVDLGGSGSRPVSLIDGDDFEAYAEEQDRKARRR